MCFRSRSALCCVDEWMEYALGLGHSRRMEINSLCTSGGLPGWNRICWLNQFVNLLTLVCTTSLYYFQRQGNETERTLLLLTDLSKLEFSHLAFITVSSWLPRFKKTPPGNTSRQLSSSSSTSKLFLPRSTKSPLKTYGFSGDGSPFWKIRNGWWRGMLIISRKIRINISLPSRFVSQQRSWIIFNICMRMLTKVEWEQIYSQQTTQFANWWVYKMNIIMMVDYFFNRKTLQIDESSLLV